MDADNAVAQTTAAPLAEPRQCPPAEYIEFFRGNWKLVVRTVMYSGGTKEQADEAAQAAMAEVYRRWADIGEPVAYARRAAISHFLKAKSGLDRVRVRLIEGGAASLPGRSDTNLTLWEDRQWVLQLLHELPPGQASVMGFVVDGFTPSEIAGLLGRSPEAVRQSLRDARSRLKKMIKSEQDAGARSLGKEAR